MVIGRLENDVAGLASRSLFVLGGILLALPGNEIMNVSNAELALAAAVVLLLGAGLGFAARRRPAVESAE